MKARGPSLASSLVKTSMPILASTANASFSAMPSVSRMVRRIACTASGPLAAIDLGELQRLGERLAVGHDVADQADRASPRPR